MKIADGALIELIHAAKTDVRACLNALQMLSATRNHIDLQVFSTERTVGHYVSLARSDRRSTQLSDVLVLAAATQSLFHCVSP